MMDVLKWVPLLILVVLILILLIGNIVIVQQSKAYVVERLGGSGAVCVPVNCPRRSGVLPCLRGEVRPMRGAPRKPGLGHSDYSDFYPLTAG